MTGAGRAVRLGPMPAGEEPAGVHWRVPPPPPLFSEPSAARC